jgi:hypothetical protein
MPRTPDPERITNVFNDAADVIGDIFAKLICPDRAPSVGHDATVLPAGVDRYAVVRHTGSKKHDIPFARCETTLYIHEGSHFTRLTDDRHGLETVFSTCSGLGHWQVQAAGDRSESPPTITARHHDDIETRQVKEAVSSGYSFDLRDNTYQVPIRHVGGQ